MYKKPVILILALLLPAVIFVFLKQFGENKFTVEPLFQDSIIVSEKCNGIEYKTPYTINDTILHSLKWSDDDSITIVIFEDTTRQGKHEQLVQIGRILKELPGDDYRIMFLQVEQGQALAIADDRLIIQPVLKTSSSFCKACVLLLTEVWDAAIIDSKKRIIGQYSLLNREDADRLILEGKILLKHY